MLVRLNMLLLFLVAIEPFLFNLLAIEGIGPLSPIAPQVSVYYAVDIASMNLILAYFTHVLTLEERNLIPRELARHFKVVRNLLVLTSAVFLFSALPAFWTFTYAEFPLRIVLWMTTFPIIWASRLSGARLRHAA